MPVQTQRKEFHYCTCKIRPFSFSSRNLLVILTILLLVGLKSSYTSAYDNCGESSQHCTCSMKATLDYLNAKAVVPRRLLSREPNAVSEIIQKYQCVQFDQLPEALTLQWTAVDTEHRFTRRQRFSRSQRLPRSDLLEGISLPSMKEIYLLPSNDNYDGKMNVESIGESNARKRRQVALGYPSNDLFGEIIPRLPPKSLHQYIPLGSQAVLHCFGPAEVVEDSPWLERKFQWTHSNGRLVSASEMSVDKQTGDLTLKAVQLSDSDIYNCQITYQDEDSPDVETVTHSQQLDVVAEPIIWLKFSVMYTTDKCDHEEMLLIQEHLVPWVHQYVCYFCNVRNYSVSCILNGDDSQGENEAGGAYQNIIIRLAMSTLGLEYQMTSFGSYYSEACPLPCVESLHLKILQVARNSLEKLFRLEIDIQASQEEKTSTYSPQPDTIDANLAVGCPSGFFENYKLCFPCPPGHYSPNGNSECLKCPVGRYQPTPGSAVCLPCPHGYSTAREESIAEFDCKTEYFVTALQAVTGSSWLQIVLIIVGIIVVLLLPICLIPYFCPNTFCGRLCTSCSCCGPNPDEDQSNSKHYGKRNSRNSADRHIKYRKLQNTENTGEDTDDDDLPVSERRKRFEVENGYSGFNKSKLGRTNNYKSIQKNTPTFLDSSDRRQNSLNSKMGKILKPTGNSLGFQNEGENKPQPHRSKKNAVQVNPSPPQPPPLPPLPLTQVSHKSPGRINQRPNYPSTFGKTVTKTPADVTKNKNNRANSDVTQKSDSKFRLTSKKSELKTVARNNSSANLIKPQLQHNRDIPSSVSRFQPPPSNKTKQISGQHLNVKTMKSVHFNGPNGISRQPPGNLSNWKSTVISPNEVHEVRPSQSQHGLPRARTIVNPKQQSFGSDSDDPPKPLHVKDIVRKLNLEQRNGVVPGKIPAGAFTYNPRSVHLHRCMRPSMTKIRNGFLQV